MWLETSGLESTNFPMVRPLGAESRGKETNPKGQLMAEDCPWSGECERPLSGNSAQ
jgi:hypothetical protein